ncbi:ImmA/IrrE family metallo-endopeptidase [Sedimentimonas flavescens]|uniref:ImmA/IrrE family metallo-endopeptidase n=1 Tax=Sedimentimonas flavescens TaxID=2851012 RepID=UPI0021A3D2D5|nr:ImmA/IrrE family metallo-endopeptidase [Sedimentimonas flavescens]MCT2538748.1 ImmA/IrrE family metallo-endopeptidase [Sedimentimonas flavescens]
MPHVDDERYWTLRERLRAAEIRFCDPDNMSFEGALHSFSQGLRSVVRVHGRDVDIVEAKRWFRVHLKEQMYTHELPEPSTPGTRLVRPLMDRADIIPDEDILALGRAFSKPLATVKRDLFEAADEAEEERNRALVDQLIADTRLYDTAKGVKELLEFTARMRHIAPFNAMLLHIQKPGLSFAARPKDWLDRFLRWPKAHARPLVVLRNFGPVEFFYDILDTEGEPLPDAALSFPTSGDVPERWLSLVEQRLREVDIHIVWLDRGDYTAGHARRLTNHGEKQRLERFEVGVNRNHPPASQLVTLAHELAHIFLGHCGGDEKRGVKFNRPEALALREVEAETVAYLVAKRTGLSPRSESYLDRYQGGFDHLDFHRIFKVVSRVEKQLDLPFREMRIFQ